MGGGGESVQICLYNILKFGTCENFGEYFWNTGHPNKTSLSGMQIHKQNGCMKCERHESLFASILFLTHWNIPVSALNSSLGTNWVNKINMTIWCHLRILAFYKRNCLVDGGSGSSCISFSSFFLLDGDGCHQVQKTPLPTLTPWK